MLGNARGGVKLNIFGGARSAPRFFILFWVEKLGLGGGYYPHLQPRGGYYPFYPPTSYAPGTEVSPGEGIIYSRVTVSFSESSKNLIL